MATVGFVGLGNMGSVLAANLVGSGHDVVSHDVAGPERNPDGATFVDDLAQLAGRADVVVLSLPDGAASERVAQGRSWPPRTTGRVPWSTPRRSASAAAREIDDLLAAAGVGYVDAPVSGGVAGATARTLLVMYAGPDADLPEQSSPCWPD